MIAGWDHAAQSIIVGTTTLCSLTVRKVIRRHLILIATIVRKVISRHLLRTITVRKGSHLSADIVKDPVLTLKQQ